MQLVLFLNDGERPRMLDLTAVVELLNRERWHDNSNPSESERREAGLRRTLEQTGWYTGVHDYGRFAVIDLDRLLRADGTGFRISVPLRKRRAPRPPRKKEHEESAHG
jgi:hypothetical protein